MKVHSKRIIDRMTKCWLHWRALSLLVYFIRYTSSRVHWTYFLLIGNHQECTRLEMASQKKVLIHGDASSLQTSITKCKVCDILTQTLYCFSLWFAWKDSVWNTFHSKKWDLAQAKQTHHQTTSLNSSWYLPYYLVSQSFTTRFKWLQVSSGIHHHT